MLAIYCKGICEPNPGGVIAWAFVVADPDTGELLERQLGSVPAPAADRAAYATNVIAEHVAVQHALTWLGAHDVPAIIYDCLTSVLGHLSGPAPDDDTPLARMIAKGHTLAAGRALTWEHIPNVENRLAVSLAHAAYRQATGHEPTDWGKKRGAA